MQKNSDTPQTFYRECGGWLAVSGPDEPLKIGVTAETEEEVVANYKESLAAWRRTLDAGQGSEGLDPLQ